MKNLKTILFLFVFVCCAQSAKSLEQGSLGSKIKLKDPLDVSNQANKPSSFSTGFDDPFINGGLNGMGNMIQGMNGNSSNIYAMQEQQKLQGDYAKQSSPVKED